jgi:type IV pilus assembly protein PilE
VIFKTKGFSLVELMVVIAIIAILASVAMPAYTNYILKSHRSEASAELLSAASAADNFEIRNGVFPSGSDISTFYHASSQNDYYTLAYCGGGDAICPNVDYVITATANDSQEGDTPCKSLEIEVSGAIINKTPTECWS